MTTEQFRAWAKNVRDILYRDIKETIYQSGSYPEAVIAGGEYQYALMEDYREIQHTADNILLWRGIPLIRAGALNKVKVVWHMVDAVLPEPPKEEENEQA